MSTSPIVGTSLAAIALIAVFSLSACSAEVVDISDETGSRTQEEPQLPSTEPGIIYADFPESVTVVETLLPELNQITTPVGTLTIHEIEVVETVPAAAVDVLSQEFDGEARPAEGEIFRILNLGFASDTDEVKDAGERPKPILALLRSGQYIHLSHLVSGQEHRILISVPENEEAHLIVSFEGQEHHIDARSGERLEDGVGAPTVSTGA